MFLLGVLEAELNARESEKELILFYSSLYILVGFRKVKKVWDKITRKITQKII